MRDRSAAGSFGIMVYQGVEPIDIGGTVGVISMARRVLPAIEAAVVAAEPGQVALAGGLSIVAQHGFAEAPVFDQVIFCGGPGWPAAAEDASLRAFLRRQPATSIASICTGALILAAAGVLDGRAATTRRRATVRKIVLRLRGWPNLVVTFERERRLWLMRVWSLVAVLRSP